MEDPVVLTGPMVAWLGGAFASLISVITYLWAMHVSNHKENKSKLGQQEVEIKDLQQKHTEVYGELKKLEGHAFGFHEGVKETAKAVTDRVEVAIPKAVNEALGVSKRD